MAVSDNPLYSSQWHFRLIGDIEAVWADYTGVGVNVGIFDDGTQRSHQDLDANYNAALHFNNLITDNGQPILADDGHGTSVAGVIGAENNSIGGVGVAYDVNLTGVNYLGFLQQQGGDVPLDALRHGSEFDITNNSWGFTPTYDASLSIADPTTFMSLSAEVFRLVAQEGRGGLGTISIKAAGNEANNPVLEAQGVFGSAQGEGLNSLHEIITVAATTRTGNAQNYSNFGVNLTVSAPAAAVTTDRTGAAGYDPGDFTSSFGGTSAATPVVAGVVALMLDANENLGWRDVQNILSVSASHTGSAHGSASGTGNEIGAWFSNGAANWNGGGMTYHLSYGFGMVDAYAAVRMAEIWSRLYPTAQVSDNMRTVTASMTGGPVTIRDNATAVATVNVTGNLSIEHIYVTITGTHTYLGDLTITLVSPSDETYTLFLNEGGSTRLDGTWTYGVTAALGDRSAGAWRVEVRDSGAGDTGQITNVRLEFEGSAITTNTVHHITDDFLTYAAVDTERRRITDTDGGADWLNMVAIPGGTSVELAANAVVRVGGVAWATLVNGEAFENVATGDGNDTVTGNILNNEILSGRGNDQVDAGFGADIIDGGAGNDTLVGAQGADTIFGGDGRDVIFGNTAADRIDAGGGDDSVSAGEGADTISGGTGNDTLFGRSGIDVINGDAGNDSIIGSEGADTLNGGDDNDIIYGGSAFDVLFGNDGDDTLFGNFGADILSGGLGADELTGGSGDDTLRGGDGNDSIYGNQGRDSIEGGAGDDILRGGTLADRFIFNTGFGRDHIEDFEDSQDSLRISRDVTGGVVLTGQQVIDRFATVVGQTVVFDFGDGMTITLDSVSTTANLADNIFIL